MRGIARGKEKVVLMIISPCNTDADKVNQEAAIACHSGFLASRRGLKWDWGVYRR